MTKLTTSVAAKVIAAVLLIACSFTCIGSIIGAAVIIDTWTGSNGTNMNSVEAFSELSDTQKDIAYDYASFIKGSYAGVGAEFAKDKGSSVPYLGYWTNYEDMWPYANMYDCRNLSIQVYDFSNGGVTYDEKGNPIYNDQKAADDKLYMYDTNSKAAFLLGGSGQAADQRVYSDMKESLRSIQLQPQSYAYQMSDVYGSESVDEPYYYDQGEPYATEYDDGVNVTKAATKAADLAAEGTYGMEFVGVKVFKDGMPQERSNGTLLFDSDQILNGDRSSSAAPENVKGYTVALMHRNGMVAFCTIKEPFEYIDRYWMKATVFDIVLPLQNALIPMAVISGLIALALFIFLMIAAGRRAVVYEDTADTAHEEGAAAGSRDGAEEPFELDDENTGENGGAQDAVARAEKATIGKAFTIEQRWPDSIPLDLFFVLICCVVGSIGGICTLGLTGMAASTGIGAKLSSVYPIAVICIIAGIAIAAACVEFCMSCSVRFKLGRWWKNTLCWRVCAWALHLCGRIIKKILGPAASATARPVKVLAKQAVKAIGSIGVQWKLSVLTAIILAANLFMGYEGYWHGGMLFLMIIADIVIFLAILAIGLMLRRLQKGGEALASGDLKAKVDTDKMVGDFKRHGENLNSISDGMAIAIDQRMRSERLKTELITNVSHDIKTPLTSIVNYVDLLSKEDLEGMPAEYVEVLQRQSARLKKLTEDLVEASKAATGNINVDLKKTDIRETVNQAVGEYSEKLEKAALNVVVNAPETPVMAEADGRLLWRVLDNLLSNVCKYSMQGTRVYITVSETGAAGVTAGKQYTAAREGLSGIVRIEVKNISRDVLNVSAEDLMERFVRGDSSRTSATEGSGLGLNIAKSLTELQGGRFRLTVDGDLFKAEIILKK